MNSVNKHKSMIFASVVVLLGSCNDGRIIGDSRDLKGIRKQEGFHAAFFNNAGTLCALGSTSGELLVTDTMLRVLRTVPAHKGGVTSCFFSSDDRYIISGGLDSSVTIWDVETLTAVRTVRLPYAVYACAMQGDVFAACGESGWFSLYSDTGADKVFSAQVSENSLFFLFFIDSITVLHTDGAEIVERSAMDGSVCGIYEATSTSLLCAVPSPDGLELIAAGADGIAYVYARQSKNLVRTIGEGGAGLFVASFSPCGKFVATSDEKGVVRLYDGKGKVSSSRVFAHRANGIHYSRDGRSIIASSQLEGARIIRAEGLSVIATFPH